MGLEKALAVGFFPFIIGDTIKIVAAAAAARILRPIVGLSPRSIFQKAPLSFP
jgi:biotin transporter BioY